MFRLHISSAKLSRNPVCDQRRLTALIAVHHVKLEQISYLFQLAACLVLPFLQAAANWQR